MYRVGYFLILITVLIPISVDYAMQGGLAAGCLLWFAADTVRAVLLYRVTLLLLQLGTFTGCVLFLRSYVPEKNGSLLVLLGTALYMISPICFYVCYDLVDFAVAFFLMGLPFAGWAALKAGQQWKKKRIAGTAGYSVTGLMCVALSMAVIFLDPVKTDFEMLRERYYINDMFRAFVYRTGRTSGTGSGAYAGSRSVRLVDPGGEKQVEKERTGDIAGNVAWADRSRVRSFYGIWSAACHERGKQRSDPAGDRKGLCGC